MESQPQNHEFRNNTENLVIALNDSSFTWKFSYRSAECVGKSSGFIIIKWVDFPDNNLSSR